MSAATGTGRAAAPGDRSDAADPGGAVLAVCTGHRCAALHRGTGPGADLARAGGDGPGADGPGADGPGSDGLDDLRAAVRDSRGAILLTTSCLGQCAQAPVVCVGHRLPGRREIRVVAGASVFGPLARGPVRQSLGAWLRSGAAPGSGVPPLLAARDISPVMRRREA